jgi:hypothetical protein
MIFVVVTCMKLPSAHNIFTNFLPNITQYSFTFRLLTNYTVINFYFSTIISQFPSLFHQTK